MSGASSGRFRLRCVCLRFEAGTASGMLTEVQFTEGICCLVERVGMEVQWVATPMSESEGGSHVYELLLWSEGRLSAVSVKEHIPLKSWIGWRTEVVQVVSKFGGMTREVFYAEHLERWAEESASGACFGTGLAGAGVDLSLYAIATGDNFHEVRVGRPRGVEQGESVATDVFDLQPLLPVEEHGLSFGEGVVQAVVELEQARTLLAEVKLLAASR